MPDQAEVLKDDANPASEGRQRIARRIAQLLAEQLDPPARRPLGKVEKLEQRGFAGAGWAGEEIKAALAEAKVEIAQDFSASPVAQSYRIEFDDCSQPKPPSRLPYSPVGRACQASRIPVYR